MATKKKLRTSGLKAKSDNVKRKISPAFASRAEQKQLISKIDNIELLSLKVEVVDEDLIKTLNSKKFSFEINLKITFDKANNMVILTSNIKIFKDLNKDLFLGEIYSKGQFYIENYNDVVDNETNLPTSVASLFAGVLISTTRGFLIIKSKGTILDGAMIPFFDARKLFKGSNATHK
ncbi:MAG: hypothetical protein JNL24_07355 [Bacteroidia bacterium]|nr:hypothetical protein [Bacteroidia bacterium]